jgi:hypothetical protein
MHTIKIHGKAKLYLHLFLGLAVDGSDLSASHLACFTPMRLGGPKSQCGYFREEKNLLPLPGMEADSFIIQPIA